MKPIFTPRDFQEIYSKIMRDGYRSKGAGDMWEPDTCPDHIAAIANDIIEEQFLHWPVVHGYKSFTGNWFFTEERNPKLETHLARLAFIELIEPCKHEPSFLREYIGPNFKSTFSKCTHCGVELVAEWKAKE